MRALSSYSFATTTTTAGNTTVVQGRFEAPNRLYESAVVNGRPSTEAYFIAGQAIVKDPTSGQWRNGTQAAGTSTDARTSFDALLHATNVTRSNAELRFVLTGGNAARVLRSAAAPSIVRGTTTITNGRISGLTFTATVSGRSFHVTASYTDLGTAPPVAPPPAS
jgi:hypothetical protein